MTPDETPWHSTLYGLLPDPDGERVAVIRQGDGYSLPQAAVWEDTWRDSVGTATRALSQVLGGPVRALRCVAYASNKERRRCVGVFELETGSLPSLLPAGGWWRRVDELDGDLNLDEPEGLLPLASVTQTWLNERLHGAIPPQRPAWARPGWYTEAIAWATAELERLGRPASGPVEQVRSWSLSCVLRFPTSGGDIYFKAAGVSPLFVNESVVTAELARLFAPHIVLPLAIEPTRRWMLLPAFEKVFPWQAQLAEREALVRLFGGIQRASIPHRGNLLRVGLLDRRLEVLATQIEALLTAGVELAGCAPAEVARLRALAPCLKQWCAELAGYPLPATLAHGDLHTANVALYQGQYVVFDWTDACWTHPFVDQIDIFNEQDPALQTHLRDVYLAGWEPLVPRPVLLAAWELARPLAMLHQAVSYHHIVSHLEPTAQIESMGGLRWYLSQLLSTAEALAAGA